MLMSGSQEGSVAYSPTRALKISSVVDEEASPVAAVSLERLENKFVWIEAQGRAGFNIWP
jgi:hypothetical protein